MGLLLVKRDYVGDSQRVAFLSHSDRVQIRLDRVSVNANILWIDGMTAAAVRREASAARDYP